MGVMSHPAQHSLTLSCFCFTCTSTHFPLFHVRVYHDTVEVWLKCRRLHVWKVYSGRRGCVGVPMYQCTEESPLCFLVPSVGHLSLPSVPGSPTCFLPLWITLHFLEFYIFKKCNNSFSFLFVRSASLQDGPQFTYSFTR